MCLLIKTDPSSAQGLSSHEHTKVTMMSKKIFFVRLFINSPLCFYSEFSACFYVHRLYCLLNLDRQKIHCYWFCHKAKGAILIIKTALFLFLKKTVTLNLNPWQLWSRIWVIFDDIELGMLLNGQNNTPHHFSLLRI